MSIGRTRRAFPSLPAALVQGALAIATILFATTADAQKAGTHAARSLEMSAIDSLLEQIHFAVQTELKSARVASSDTIDVWFIADDKHHVLEKRLVRRPERSITLGTIRSVFPHVDPNDVASFTVTAPGLLGSPGLRAVWVQLCCPAP